MIKKTFDGEEYAWVQYHKILDDLPLLNIKKRAIAERMNKLCDLDILKFIMLKEEGKGTFSYYKYGKKLDTLTDVSVLSSNNGVAVQTATGSRSNSNGLQFNQPSIYNNTVKDNKVKDNNTKPKRYGGLYV